MKNTIVLSVRSMSGVVRELIPDVARIESDKLRKYIDYCNKCLTYDLQPANFGVWDALEMYNGGFKVDLNVGVMRNLRNLAKHIVQSASPEDRAWLEDNSFAADGHFLQLFESIYKVRKETKSYERSYQRIVNEIYPGSYRKATVTDRECMQCYLDLCIDEELGEVKNHGEKN